MATTVPRPSATDAISYADLYARWERGNWRATEIDFSQDAVDWHEKLTEEQRRSALWLYALFFHGEDSVADNLSPYIDAAPTEEQNLLPHHAAGRRGAPQRLLQALHARGRRPRRRHVARDARATSSSSPGAIARCSRAWTAWPTSCAATAPSPSWPPP
jgi:hypothetical protein